HAHPTQVCYFENGTRRRSGANHYTLSFELDDCCFLAMCFPYTFSQLHKDMNTLCAEHPEMVKRTLLCTTLAGNNCDMLTITSPAPQHVIDERKILVFSGRVHPGESNASWIVKGIIQFIALAKALRENFVFLIVPMLNPDGVINGHYRVALSGHDLNRMWVKPDREKHATVWHLKEFLMKLCETNRPLLYIDVHGHSIKRNVFMYGCNPQP
ncbi:hypothetical protein T484DRAFT_1797007, partial [Baffinella frigidus]